MTTVAVVSVARSDAGIYVSIVEGLVAAGAEVALHVIDEAAAGVLVAVGGVVRGVVDGSVGGDSDVDVAVAAGRVSSNFAASFARAPPTWVVVLGDRWEMHAAAVAAALSQLPIAHVHGGELTLGAVDDALRHAITKLSHLHFTSSEGHARRVRQLGEEDWRVVVAGAPGLDRLCRAPDTSFAEWRAAVGVKVEQPFALVTWHPVTRHVAENIPGVDAIFDALAALHLSAVVTAPGNDAASAAIRARIAARVGDGDAFVESFGDHFAGALRHADVMVGNSSSALIEAPLFRLPAVNVGVRQLGRERGDSVFDVDVDAAAIAAAVIRGRAWRGTAGRPAARGRAGATIAARLLATPIDERLLRKGFIDR